MDSEGAFWQNALAGNSDFTGISPLSMKLLHAISRVLE